MRVVNREERKERRQRELKQAVIVFAIMICIVLALVLGGILIVQKLLPQKQAGGQNTETTEVSTEMPTEQSTQESEQAGGSETVKVDDEATIKAKEFVTSMSLEQKVAQMFMITPEALTGYNEVTRAGSTTKSSFEAYPVGGLIYFSQNLLWAEQTAEMLEKTNGYSVETTGLPIFLGVDEEGGTVSRVASNMEFGAADVGDMSEIGATGNAQNAYLVGTSIGEYLTELGFNVNFAPVADVWINTDNDMFSARSFGSDSAMVSSMVLEELRGFEEYGLYGVVKHFPGHGATDADSHEGTATTNRTLEEMQAEEFVPFAAAIENGVDFIMVGHVSTPAVTGNDVPSSVSDYMITEILRNQMGYDGIVITDAMNMSAITSRYSSAEAAVAAINAGVDVILMPEDFKAAYTGVIDAVNNGTISMERIDEAVVRIVRVKQQMQ